MLVAQSQSWGAQVASALSFLMIAIFAFSSNDIISRKTWNLLRLEFWGGPSDYV